MANLTKMHSVMVWAGAKRTDYCRALYSDEDGNLWCKLQGKYRSVTLEEFQDYPYKGVKSHHYVANMEKQLTEQ